MKTKDFAIVLIFFLLSLFSCKLPEVTHEQPQVAKFSPLQTVRILKEDNRQYEKNPAISAQSHSPEIKAILDRGLIVFGMAAADQKPFFYKDEKTGELIGLDVEIAYKIANQLGVKALFNRDAASFDEVAQMVASKTVDIGLSKLSVTMRRAESVRFTNPYITFRQALLVNRLEFAKIGPENQLSNFIKNYRGSLGVIANSSYMNYAEINFPNADIKMYENWYEMINALFDGKILAIYRDEEEILIVNNTIKGAPFLMKPVFISDKYDNIAMAVSADAPMLQNWLNIFLDDYILQNKQELTPSRLVKKHFNKES